MFMLLFVAHYDIIPEKFTSGISQLLIALETKKLYILGLCY